MKNSGIAAKGRWRFFGHYSKRSLLVYKHYRQGYQYSLGFSWRVGNTHQVLLTRSSKVFRLISQCVLAYILAFLMLFSKRNVKKIKAGCLIKIEHWAGKKLQPSEVLLLVRLLPNHTTFGQTQTCANKLCDEVIVIILQFFCVHIYHISTIFLNQKYWFII